MTPLIPLRVWTARKRASSGSVARGVRSSSESGDPAHITVTPANGKKFRYLRLLCPKGSSFFNKHVGRQNFVQIMDLKVFPVLRKEFKPVVREVYGQKKP